MFHMAVKLAAFWMVMGWHATGCWQAILRVAGEGGRQENESDPKTNFIAGKTSAQLRRVWP
jgi:hypothetical protein